MNQPSDSPVLDQLARLSAAEDFFDFLQVEYDQAILHVCRLHILKRMGEYLNGEDLTGKSDDEVFLAARRHLERAYADFVASSPLDEKVFKVFAASTMARAGAFVSLADLAASATGGSAPIANRNLER